MKDLREVSYLTPEKMRGLLIECGYDPDTLKGGDFNKAKSGLLELTSNHTFKSKIKKQRTLRDISMCRDIVKLYDAFFNIMNVLNNPSERLNKRRYAV